MRKCPKHKTYQAKRRPQTCLVCWNIYADKLLTRIKDLERQFDQMNDYTYTPGGE